MEVSNRFRVLDALDEEKTREELWISTKTVLLEVASETMGTTKTVKVKSSISAETFSLIKENKTLQL